MNVSYEPKKGDIIFFPTNYIASHQVSKMGKGVRYSYLTFFGQGASDLAANVVISEPDQSFEWCPPVWFNNIYDDYEKYCKSEYSIWSNPEKYSLELGWNPVYQGREVAQYNTTHETIELDTSNPAIDNAVNMNLAEGPCGTDPQIIG